MDSDDADQAEDVHVGLGLSCVHVIRLFFASCVFVIIHEFFITGICENK